MPRRVAARGFSFIEILFAMAVLSIGLLGVAAAIYVGVDQTRTSLDDTVAAGVARQAAASLSQVMNNGNTDATLGSGYQVVDFEKAPKLVPIIHPAQISGIDRRYAWIPLYRRADDSPTADVLIVVIRSEVRSQFDELDIKRFDPPPNPLPAQPPYPEDARPPTLVPATAAFEISGDRVTITSVPTGQERLAPGTLLIVNDTGSPEVNGRVVKLSAIIEGDTWQLEPGHDLSDTPGTFTGNAGFIIGRGYTDVTRPRDGYSGASQAVAVYSTIIFLR
ncbi:MAG TPA: prepilin-type N-terminal cleavage/methylation domain-containing protein [Tepidisphaeraceae bacterium]|jgi:prepilin-type N-terminal cleavage/methylation domain-containing protein